MDFQRILPIVNVIVYPKFDSCLILEYPKTHFSNIPAFHYSNWGKALNLIKAII
jgi:hypothetical protein